MAPQKTRVLIIIIAVSSIDDGTYSIFSHPPQFPVAFASATEKRRDEECSRTKQKWSDVGRVAQTPVRQHLRVIFPCSASQIMSFNKSAYILDIAVA